MNRIHIVGRKNHGKTQLVVELVAELSARGLRVGTIKHTHHQHELDIPGKDSHRHRAAGASVVGILSRSMNAVFQPVDHSVKPTSERYLEFAPMFEMCDVVIVEGDAQAAAPKIEVWRDELGTRPLASDDESILAVITDDDIDVETPIHSRSNVKDLATWILANLLSTSTTRKAVSGFS